MYVYVHMYIYGRKNEHVYTFISNDEYMYTYIYIYMYISKYTRVFIMSLRGQATPEAPLHTCFPKGMRKWTSKLTSQKTWTLKSDSKAERAQEFHAQLGY